MVDTEKDGKPVRPILGGLVDWFKPKPKPAPGPTPVPEPEPTKPAGPLGYIRAWQLFKTIPVHKLFPALTATSVVVFLAISGALAWLVVFVRFMLHLFMALSGK